MSFWNCVCWLTFLLIIGHILLLFCIPEKSLDARHWSLPCWVPDISVFLYSWALFCDAVKLLGNVGDGFDSFEACFEDKSSLLVLIFTHHWGNILLSTPPVPHVLESVLILAGASSHPCSIPHDCSACSFLVVLPPHWVISEAMNWSEFCQPLELCVRLLSDPPLSSPDSQLREALGLFQFSVLWLVHFSP